MPVYEYQCDSCNSEFEILQRFSDPPMETCKECGGPVRKLISQTSFILKGTGWYATDYGNRRPNGRDSSDDKPQPAGAAASKKDQAGGSKKDQPAAEKKARTGSSAGSAAAAA